jgi:hypothetical protein
MSYVYRGPSIDVSYHVSVHYILIFCLVHLAKGNVSFCHHLASVVHRPLTRHILMFSPKTTKPNDLKLGRKHLRQFLYKDQYLLTDRDEMSNLYRGSSIYASYQVSAHLAKRFQRRRFFRNQPELLHGRDVLYMTIHKVFLFFVMGNIIHV